MSEESTDSNHPSQREPEGTFMCDVCGYGKPHSHEEFDVVQQRFARKAFEERYTTTSVSAWDGDKHTSVPQRRGPEVSAGYWCTEDNRRWGTYVSGWHDAWKHFTELDGGDPSRCCPDCGALRCICPTPSGGTVDG